MKWSIVGLFGLGLVAAVCAGVLAASMQGGGPSGPTAAPEVQDVTIILADEDLAAMRTVTKDDVSTREVSPDIAPEGAFHDPVQVIGKVLILPVTSGQVLTRESFAPEGSNAHLAAALASGRRAINIPVTNSMGIEDLLYPGCFVDVLFSTDARSDGGGAGQPVSVTLLRKVQVVAVGDKTIVAPDGPSYADEDEALQAQSMRNRSPRVTLLVDARQAEALNLAMQEGAVSLALRNPNDEQSEAGDGTLLASLLPEMPGKPEPAAPMRLPAPTPRAPAPAPVPEAAPVVWETTVLRGGKRETKTFDIEDAINNRDG